MDKHLQVLENSLQKVENYLFNTLSGHKIEEHVNSMCMHVVRSGGKRIRPRLALAAAFALDIGINEDQAVEFAAAIELLHTATLIHDDVIDHAELRRGKSTINATDGNHVAVLAGDYMFTRCFLALQSLNNMQLFAAVNNSVTALVSGELKQLEKVGDLHINFDDYETTIYCKTGALFEVAVTGMAIFSNQRQEIIDALALYGKNLGIGFQVVDDMLDYSSSSEHLGKTVGEDLNDGRITLPIIITYQDLSSEDKISFQKAVEDKNLNEVLKFINKVDALTKCQKYADKAIKSAIDALNILPNTPYKESLISIALKAVDHSL